MVTPKKRALLSLVLDDGAGSLRGVLFGEHILKLGIDEETVFSVEKFLEQKHTLLGEEKIFSGTVRANQLYNTVEMTVEGVEDVQPEMLLKELEANAV